MNYSFVENKIASVICRQERSILIFVAIIAGFFEFLYDAVRFRCRIFVKINKAFPKNSVIQNLYLTMLNYYYSILFIFDYGTLLHGRVRNINQRCRRTIIEAPFLEKSAIPLNKPVIFFTAHTGCFFAPLFSPRFRHHLTGRKIGCISTVQLQNRKDHIAERLNKLYGLDFRFIDIENRSAGFTTARILRNNGIVVCVLDTALPQTRTQRVNFLNQSIILPNGLMDLACRFGALCFPVFTYRAKRRDR